MTNKVDTNELPEGITFKFRYAQELYRGMYKKSRLVPTIELIEHGFPVNPGDPPVRIFEGYTNKIGDRLGFSPHQKGAALGLLNSMNCVTRMKTPGGKAPGLWTLNYEPTEEQFREYRGSNLRILRRSFPTHTQYIIDQLKTFATELSAVKIQLAQAQERLSELEKQRGHDVGQGPPMPQV